jgi:hypothetical protein
MVVYLSRRIKMGRGMAEAQTRTVACSPREAKDQKKRAIQPFTRIWIERSYHSSHPIAPKRIHLIGHDLRENEQTVLDGWSNDGTHPISRVDVR